MRRALVGLAAVAVAGLGLLLLLGVLSRAEDARTDAPAGPGVAVPAQRGTLGAALEAGNVVIAFRDRADAPAARARATALAGPSTPALVASGQAVLARREPIATRFAALAWRRALPLDSLDGAALPTFVDRWLGAPATG